MRRGLLYGGAFVVILLIVAVSIPNLLKSSSAPDTSERMPIEAFPSPVPAGGDGTRPSRGLKHSPEDAPDPFAAADAAIAKLKQANIAFNTPDEMTVGKAEMVQLLLSMKESIEELKAAITATGSLDGATIEVSNKMEAKLTGAGFDIRAVTPDVQVISPSAQTEWKWEVEPVTSDAKRLHLALSAHVLLDGEKIPRVVKTFERDMIVKVNWSREAYEFATGNWEWLWTVLLVPIAGLIWRKRKKDGGEDKKES
jgi:hypothetical protein